ncbi:hypothetical protein [Clostridium perfringens]|uniref:hypothetical protein n=1 Tax=Clostridium perfringens TaxID=1502 RepID=UPI0024BD2AE3|nr:hypothetical protein [Clostridium perfringens]
MNISSLIADNLMEMLKPIVLIVAFITLIYTLVILVLDDVKKFRKHNECKVEEEECEDDEWDMIQKAIIAIGDAKIEIEVDYYEIDCNIINIKGKDGELYVTDLNNVLLSSNEIDSEVA